MSTPEDRPLSVDERTEVRRRTSVCLAALGGDAGAYLAYLDRCMDAWPRHAAKS